MLDVLSSCEILLKHNSTISKHTKEKKENVCANTAQNDARISSDYFSMRNKKGCYKVYEILYIYIAALYVEYVFLTYSLYVRCICI